MLDIASFGSGVGLVMVGFLAGVVVAMFLSLARKL